MTLRVLVDANVLHSRTLRDWLFMLKLETSAGIFTLASTEDILAEAVRSIRRRHPCMDGGVVARFREVTTEHIEEMIRDFTVEEFPGDDIHDSHVHGAAVSAQVDVLLTSDAGWDSIAEQLPYDVYRPDEFFCLASDSAPRAIADVACQQIRHKLSGGAREVDLIGPLRDSGCPCFAERVRQLLQEVPSSRLKCASQA